jgi:voltage-gated potassium channel
VFRPNPQPPPPPTRVWVVLVSLVGAVALYYVLPMRGRLWPLGAIAGPAAAVALAPLTRRHLRRVLVSDRPIVDVACALALIAVVLVLGFATTYWILQTQSPGEFDGIVTKTDSLYFTVTVLSTVGFGDVHPVGQVARAVTTMNMLTNIVILAVAVRLFGWAAHQRAEVVHRAAADGAPVEHDV